ncbi:MAG: heat shock protein transcriptional repressor HspR [Actinomycetota bacterium]
MTDDERARGERDRAVYIISVAAELAGVHPQTLRSYERLGLLRPQRTSGNTRRYSERDIERLRLIQELTQQEGVNLAGVRLIMEMRAELEEIQRRAEELERRLVGPRRTVVGPGSVELVLRRSVVRPPWDER